MQNTFIMLIFQLAVLLISAVIHEFAHGWMALRLGDHTAEKFGRLTLNPLKHLDPWGSLFVPFMIFLLSGGKAIFGWAKPVPYNPYNLRDQKYGPAKVAFAGPAANLTIALVFGLSLRFLPAGILAYNGLVDILNVIVILNILLAVFNLIPIPPLDGSKILFTFLPRSMAGFGVFLERYGMILLFAFIFFGFRYVLPIVFLVYQLIVGPRAM